MSCSKKFFDWCVQWERLRHKTEIFSFYLISIWLFSAILIKNKQILQDGIVFFASRFAPQLESFVAWHHACEALFVFSGFRVRGGNLIFCRQSSQKTNISKNASRWKLIKFSADAKLPGTKKNFFVHTRSRFEAAVDSHKVLHLTWQLRALNCSVMNK